MSSPWPWGFLPFWSKSVGGVSGFPSRQDPESARIVAADPGLHNFPKSVCLPRLTRSGSALVGAVVTFPPARFLSHVSRNAFFRPIRAERPFRDPTPRIPGVVCPWRPLPEKPSRVSSRTCRRCRLRPDTRWPRSPALPRNRKEVALCGRKAFRRARAAHGYRAMARDQRSRRQDRDRGHHWTTSV